VNTIVALSTPLGRSGIGVVRLSGAEALSIVRRLIDDEDFSPDARTTHLRRLVDDETGEAIDEAVITYFKAPHSFTGEDVIEISCHGSPVLLRQVIDACLRFGARMADAGEFTLRALGSGRIDLTKAEAIRDLIDAQSKAAARQAVRQMSGEFSHELQPLKDELLDVIVVLESALEFVEDDLPTVQLQAVGDKLRAVSDRLGRLASTFKAGNLLREGIRVAIVGRPNVGKSSLFNALLGSDRAIVTSIAGTTRDQLHERLTINNIPISLIDTAGLRETEDMVESIGVERSKRTIADADIVIAMLDVSMPWAKGDEEIFDAIGDTEHVVALNKIDKVDDDTVSKFQDDLRSHLRASGPAVKLSAKTGVGLDELKRLTVAPFASEEIESSGFLVSDARHHDLLKRAADEVEHAIESLESRQSEEIVLIGLHNALNYLGRITGETTTEDMLTRIFSTFCIGK
jgi:tRNA modification GTPase